MEGAVRRQYGMPAQKVSAAADWRWFFSPGRAGLVWNPDRL